MFCCTHGAVDVDVCLQMKEHKERECPKRVIHCPMGCSDQVRVYLDSSMSVFILFLASLRHRPCVSVSYSGILSCLIVCFIFCLVFIIVTLIALFNPTSFPNRPF